jgi:hypothetical protein
MFLCSKHIITALTIGFMAVGPARAQPDPNLQPTYGSVTLKAGFLPDPFKKDVLAGGDFKTNLGGVNAHVAKAPDFRLFYTKGKFPLTFKVKSVGDTTLLINLPDGTWVADDDSGGGLDPLIRLANPQSGRYDIYVGTYKKDLLAATLYITEIDVAREPAPPPPSKGKGNLPDCYLLSAGVDNYRNADKLSGCLNDARNIAAAFKAQTGTIFRNVAVQPLLDGSATRAGILQGFQGFANQGAAKDYMVLFLSGHGGRTNGDKTWFFAPFDFHPNNHANTTLADRQILDAGDVLARQKKHVVIIVDACFCGQMLTTAQPYLNRYKNANDGSMTLMLSSAANQTSAAMGNYSAFAKAFADAMAGGADSNKDGKVTLGEIQVYTSRRTAELLEHARNKNKQDCIVAWSPSMSRDVPFAFTGKSAPDPVRPPPTDVPTRWVGTETLAGFGKLSFAMHAQGRVIMVDAKETSEGIWRKNGNEYTLSFSDGAVIYTGRLNGATLSGTATSPSAPHEPLRSWTWSVKMQPGN